MKLPAGAWESSQTVPASRALATIISSCAGGISLRRRVGHTFTVPVALLLWAALSTAAGLSAQVGPTVSSKAAITLITPSDLRFGDALDRSFPDFRTVEGFETIKPVLAIVRNDSSRPITAYIVRWNIQYADGSKGSIDRPVIGRVLDDQGLPGTATVLRPGEAELVSPYFRWGSREYARLLAVHAILITMQAVTRKTGTGSPKNAYSLLQNYTQVQAGLDGILFGDGDCMGPDTLRLCERVDAAQATRINEGVWILNQVANGVSAHQLKEKLSEQIYEGRRAEGDDAASLYLAARGRAASWMLSRLESRGIRYVQRKAALYARAARMTVRKTHAP